VRRSRRDGEEDSQVTEEEMIARGKELFQKCYNGVIPLPENLPPKSFGELNMKLINEIWGDERMSFRDKRLVVLGIIAGKGADPSLFQIHARAALRNREITTEELRFLLQIAIYYAGSPHASPLFLATEKMLAETNDGRDA
jgi:4-carboxymuconolactone decarboxylase